MLQPLNQLEFVAFDTETTGMSPYSDAIVELAAVRFHLEKGPIAHFQTLIHPERSIPAFVSKVHGITNPMVANSPKIAQVLPHFFEFISGSILVAHNANFDIGFISVPCHRNNFSLPEMDILDTCRFARRVYKNFSSYSLENLTRELKIANTTYHRALADSNSCMNLFRQTISECDGICDWHDLVRIHGDPMRFYLPKQNKITPPEHLKALVPAIQSKRKIQIQYTGNFGMREITPLLLYSRGAQQYLEATCHIDQIRKTFRIDRIEKIVLSDGSSRN